MKVILAIFCLLMLFALSRSSYLPKKGLPQNREQLSNAKEARRKIVAEHGMFAYGGISKKDIRKAEKQIAESEKARYTRPSNLYNYQPSKTHRDYSPKNLSMTKQPPQIAIPGSHPKGSSQQAHREKSRGWTWPSFTKKDKDKPEESSFRGFFDFFKSKASPKQERQDQSPSKEVEESDREPSPTRQDQSPSEEEEGSDIEALSATQIQSAGQKEQEPGSGNIHQTPDPKTSSSHVKSKYEFPEGAGLEYY